jgi:quinol monooxygenase YgiN
MYMYARQALYKLKEMDNELYANAQREVMPTFKESEGCRSSYFIIDEENSECGSFSTWESREAMENAVPRIAEKFRQLVEGRLESVTLRLFEIYQE